MSEALPKIIIPGRPSIPHSFSFQVTVCRCQDVENQFHKPQVPIIKHNTKQQMDRLLQKMPFLVKNQKTNKYMMGLELPVLNVKYRKQFQ